MTDNVDNSPTDFHVFLKQMARKYSNIRYSSAASDSDRIAACVMARGTYDDICELIDLGGKEYLTEILHNAGSSSFSERARRYWQRYLGLD